MTNLVGLLGITHGRGCRHTNAGVEQLPEEPTERRGSYSVHFFRIFSQYQIGHSTDSATPSIFAWGFFVFFVRSLLRPNLFSIILSDRSHKTSAKVSTVFEALPYENSSPTCFIFFWGTLLRVNVLSECSPWLSIETIFAFPPTSFHLTCRGWRPSCSRGGRRRR